MYMTKIKIFRFIICLIILIIIIILFSVFCSQKILSIDTYSYTNEKITTPIRVVQLTDLHNSEFGAANNRLVQKIQKQNPDVVFMTGDMLNDDESRMDIVVNLVQKVMEIAPVYYSLGNHEKAFIEKQRDGKDLVEKLEAAGAVVLEQEYADTEIAGQEVRIGGAYGYLLEGEWKDGSEQRFMEEFQETGRFKILLSHIPEGLLLWESMKYWDVDLVFSGHVHGGQVRFPGIGGLYDPEERFFPTYTKGMFECGHGTMILSAGLGSSATIPRINNLPEIVVCDIDVGE